MHRPREGIDTSLCGSVVALCLITLGLWGPSQAAEFSCAAGDVACLISAINTANANGEANTIILAAGTYSLTTVDNNVDGPNGLPSITSALTVRGQGAQSTVIERAASAPAFRLLYVGATGALTLEGLTLTGGSVGSLAGGGGGILARGGSVTLTHSTLMYNSTSVGFGGGIYANGGRVTLSDSTLAHNSAGGSGGGIAIGGSGSAGTLGNVTLAYNWAGGSGGGIFTLGGSITLTNVTLAYNSTRSDGGSGGGILVANGSVTLTNVTLAYNSAGDRAGGIFTSGLSVGRVILQNTVLARNMTQGSGPDCVGPVTSLGNNLLGDPTGCTINTQPTDLTSDPRLGNFTDGGIPGRGYFPLLPDSPAIDTGNDSACPPTDQLGQPRVGRCDIGAIEFQPSDMVSIRQAIVVDQLSVIFVVATSSAAPEAELFVTVPGCLTEAPMLRIVNRYLFLRDVHACGNLEDDTAIVTSSHGGSASAPFR